MTSYLERFSRYRDSDRAALVCGGDALSYLTLHGLACALAGRLRARGVGLIGTEPDRYDIYEPASAAHSPWVVIACSRGPNAVVGILAAHMAGGAFVLMEPGAPEAYLQGVIEDTRADVVLRDADFVGLDPSARFEYAMPSEREICCAVFTSGSTGRPKGAVLEHRAIDELAAWQTAYMRPEGWTATASFAPLSFIAFISEVFFPLANGLTLHILRDDTRHDLQLLCRYIDEHDIRYLFLPPNIAEMFTTAYRGAALRYLRVAGGRLKACADPEGRYEILYSLGMAENCGSVTLLPIREARSGEIPIGMPWHRTVVHLLGEEGRMAVSGPSLFRGYLSRRDETEKQLLVGPDGEPMYVSGDLAAWNDRGELVHRGRADWVVKIRDMKVDPMQVESALAGCQGVVECCVTAEQRGGDAMLIGWYAGEADQEALRAALADVLPEHMVPGAFVHLDALPRNPNGKVDRKALRYERDAAEGSVHLEGREAAIAALFERVLELPPHSVGAGDSFVALGGNSLKLMRLQMEMAGSLGLRLAYTQLAQRPTPAALAMLSGDAEQIPAAPARDAYPLTPPMRQMWLLWRTGQDQGKYTISITSAFDGALDAARAQAAVEELVRRNGILRSRFEERDGEAVQVVVDGAGPRFCDVPRRAFDLREAPLLDVSFGPGKLSLTTHHIVADAAGMRAMVEDFWTLYAGGEPARAAQAQDIAMWVKPSEDGDGFWRGMFAQGSPGERLADALRPIAREAQAGTSGEVVVMLDRAEAQALSAYAAARGATLFGAVLAGYALLLSRILGSGSVVIGVPLSGREHPDTARSIAMCVRTLPLRMDVAGLSLDGALALARDGLIALRRHQDMDLVALQALTGWRRAGASNPFYSVMINDQPLPTALPDVESLRPRIERSRYPAALFELVLDLREEEGGGAALVLTYDAGKFGAADVARWAEGLRGILVGEARNGTEAVPYDLDRGVGNALCGVPSPVAPVLDESLPQFADLCAAWVDVLGAKPGSGDADFFAAGGTSLHAIRLEAALYGRNWLLSAADVLQGPTLLEMAAAMTPADDVDWEDDDETL